MAGYLFLGTMAAFGTLCALWGLLGFLLPQCREGCLIYRGRREKPGFVPLYLWLRALGLINCPLILVDWGMGEPARRALTSRGIEIYSLEELPQRLGIGAEQT